MATQEPQRRPHLFPNETRTTEGYTAKGAGGGGQPNIPALPRVEHAQGLRAQLAHVADAQVQLVAQQQAAAVQLAVGVQIEFESQAGVELAAESLARDQQGIELMNVRAYDDRVMATVFVPPGKLEHFEKLLTAYEEQRTDSAGRPRDCWRRPEIEPVMRVVPK